MTKKQKANIRSLLKIKDYDTELDMFNFYEKKSGKPKFSSVSKITEYDYEYKGV